MLTFPRNRFSELIYCTLERDYDCPRIWWVSSKPTDALPLMNFSDRPIGVISMISGSLLDSSRFSVFSVEDDTGHRFDYDLMSFTDKRCVKTLRNAVKELSSTNNIIIPFSPNRFLTNIGIMLNKTSLLSNNEWLYDMLSYKPLVEYYLNARNVRLLPSTSIMPGFLSPSSSYEYPLVRRLSTGTGGVGHSLTRNSDTPYPGDWIDIVNDSPFFRDLISFSITGCIYRDGGISYHPPSLQIIGAPECTSNLFGYCGNEYGTTLEHLSSNQIEELVLYLSEITKYLRENEYLGTFGVDFVTHNGHLYIMEVNPRFQASSIISSAILTENGLPTVHEDHVMAFLGIDANITRPTIRDLLSMKGRYAQIFSYATGGQSQITEYSIPSLEVVKDVPISCKCFDPNALRYRLLINGCVLNDGRYLLPHIAEYIKFLNNTELCRRTSKL